VPTTSVVDLSVQRIVAGKEPGARREARRARRRHRPRVPADVPGPRRSRFGNLKDEGSNATKLTHSPRAYHVLEEIGTRPSVTYLRKVVREHA